MIFVYFQPTMVDNIEEPNEQIEEQDNFADDSQDPPIEDATRYIVKVSVATHTCPIF